jgi:hypothetical protein
MDSVSLDFKLITIVIFQINPLTGSLIDVSKIYHSGDTYDSVFTSLGSAYEECRAEAVGLHLCVYPEFHKYVKSLALL